MLKPLKYALKPCMNVVLNENITTVKLLFFSDCLIDLLQSILKLRNKIYRLPTLYNNTKRVYI